MIKKIIKLYEQDGKEIVDEKIEEELRKVWEGVFQMYPNNIEKEWNEEKIREYMNESKSDKIVLNYRTGIRNVEGVFIYTTDD